jgi:hypothetical protein
MPAQKPTALCRQHTSLLLLALCLLLLLLLLLQTKYYTDKLELPDASPRWTSVVVQHYIRGLHWVLQYYYRGVASWDWFYPYHYAPMAQDMRQLSNIDGTTDCWMQANSAPAPCGWPLLYRDLRYVQSERPAGYSTLRSRHVSST